jgi:TetR/AcrR family acrAB operon transcriptional repressor
MVRRTKEDSQETRRAIIAAAREVFYHNGVTRTTLEQIAAAAKVTRGAIYWHFAGKAELFYAMRDEVRLPLVDCSDVAFESDRAALDPLERIEHFLEVVVDLVANDEATRRTFEIVTFKCEYVDEFARDLETACTMHTELQAKLATHYRDAQRRGLLRDGLVPARAASDTMIFLSGLIRIWLVDESGSLVKKNARRLIADHIEGKRSAERMPDKPASSASRRTAKLAAGSPTVRPRRIPSRPNRAAAK